MLALCQVSYILYGCILFTGMWFALIWANYVPVFVNKIDACRPKEERIERITAGTNRFDIVKYMSRSCGNNTQLRLFLFLGLFFSSINSVISPTQKALAGRHLSLVICSGRIYATNNKNKQYINATELKSLHVIRPEQSQGETSPRYQSGRARNTLHGLISRAYSQSHELCLEEWENEQRANSCCYRSHSGIIHTVSSIKLQVTSKSVSTCQRINVSTLKPLHVTRNTLHVLEKHEA